MFRVCTQECEQSYFPPNPSLYTDNIRHILNTGFSLLDPGNNVGYNLRESNNGNSFRNGDPELNLKSSHTVPVGDYSGAVAKDDPTEVALVRKLDWRIMPILWSTYFMNYVSPPPLQKFKLMLTKSCSWIEMLLPIPDSMGWRRISDFTDCSTTLASQFSLLGR
jgi:hypothetical protein